MVKHLIICEGSTDKVFLEELLEHLKISNIEVGFVGRDKKNKNKSSIFKREKYDTIKEEIGTIYKSLLIVFDADYEKDNKVYGGFTNSEREIKSLIDDLNLNNRADYYIVCDPITKNGYLESLILSTIPNEERKCIKAFIDCSRFKDKEKDKAILNQIYKLGYPNTPYNFPDDNFYDLKKKLIALKS